MLCSLHLPPLKIPHFYTHTYRDCHITKRKNKQFHSHIRFSMAVEARYLNLSPPQMLYNRDVMLNGLDGMNNGYSTNMFQGLSPVTAAAATAAEMVSPVYATTMMKAESGLTYAHLPVISRKRSREDSNNSINMNNQLGSFQTLQNQNFCGGGNHRSAAGQFTFLGEDFSSQIQQQQLEVNSFIAHHSEKVRLDIEERRKRYSRRIMAAVEEGIMKKLKAKEDEIQKIVKFNWALEERVKSLSVENQIWRDLAQTNEATANVLRTNLEQVLAHVQNTPQNDDVEGGLIDDAQSCCDSNGNELDNNFEAIQESAGRRIGEGRNRVCRNCGEGEACVLLLPCRHLCLCSICGSSQNVCPVCNSTKTCSLHVNMDS